MTPQPTPPRPALRDARAAVLACVRVALHHLRREGVANDDGRTPAARG